MTNLTKYFKQAPLYDPPMMQFDGASYYSKTGLTTTGNKTTMIVRFSMQSFSDGSLRYVGRMEGNATGARIRMSIWVAATDYSTVAYQDKIGMLVQDGSTNVALLVCSGDFLDGEEHTVLASYDGDAGTAVFIIDGTDQDDTGNAGRIAPTTGTLQTSSAGRLYMGSLGGSNHIVGHVSFFGYKDAYLTNWSDFMDVEGKPQLLDQFGWTQWGGGTFAPATQLFNGSTGYFSKSTITTTGNKVTATFTFNRAAFTGGTSEWLVRMLGAVEQRVGFLVSASDHSTTDYRSKLRVYVENSSNVIICLLVSTATLCDGQDHTVFFSFDGDTGAAIFRVDGANADDTGNASRVAPTTGTLDSSASSTFSVGALATASGFFGGEIGFCGYADAYLTNWGDFMDANGVPQEIDELNWTEWGGQPLFWNKYGAMDDNKGSAGNATRNGTVTHTSNSQPLFWHEAAKMDENLGSAGAMTENGTIKLAPESVIWKPDHGKAILTPGSAVPADLRLGKTAWVGGQQITGSQPNYGVIIAADFRGSYVDGLSLNTADIAYPMLYPGVTVGNLSGNSVIRDVEGIRRKAEGSGFALYNVPAYTNGRHIICTVDLDCLSFTNGLMDINTNFVDGSNLYFCRLWNISGAYWDIRIYSVISGTTTQRAIATINSTIEDAYGVLQVTEFGDTLMFSATLYEKGTSTLIDNQFISYYTPSRPLKTNHNFRVDFEQSETVRLQSILALNY